MNLEKTENYEKENESMDSLKEQLRLSQVALETMNAVLQSHIVKERILTEKESEHAKQTEAWKRALNESGRNDKTNDALNDMSNEISRISRRIPDDTYNGPWTVPVLVTIMIFAFGSSAIPVLRIMKPHLLGAIPILPPWIAAFYIVISDKINKVSKIVLVILCYLISLIVVAIISLPFEIEDPICFLISFVPVICIVLCGIFHKMKEGMRND